MTVRTNAVRRAARRLGPPALSLLVLALGAAPATAIRCGKAIPLVQLLTIAPAAHGWTATAVISDFDSAVPLSDIAVRLRGAGLPSFYRMRGAAAPGTYTLALPDAVPGPITVDVTIESIPGGTAVASLDKQWAATLPADRAVTLARVMPVNDASTGTIVVVLAVVGLAATGGAARLRAYRRGDSGPG